MYQRQIRQRSNLLFRLSAEVRVLPKYGDQPGCKGVDLTEDQLIAGMQRLIDAGRRISIWSAPPNTHRPWRGCCADGSPGAVVYNTGGYERLETLRQLEGLIDIYLRILSILARLRRRLTALRRTMWSRWARRCWKCAARCRTVGQG